MADAQANQRPVRHSFVLSRERSFVRPPSQFQHYLYPQSIIQNKRIKNVDIQSKNTNKPTMEIYRPPSVRTEGGDLTNPRLNVHAKEFTMNYGQLQPSRSSGNILVAMDPYYQPYKLQSSLSTPRVHFCLQPLQDDVELVMKNKHAAFAQAQLQTHLVHQKSAFKISDQHTPKQRSSGSGSPDGTKQVRFQAGNVSPSFPALQRSKSLGAADVLARQAAAGQDSISELGEFTPELQANIYKARQDPNSLAPRILMELVCVIMERVLESRRHAEPAAKLCINIIERERKETFLETLLNTCQQWYQERDRVLRSAGNTKVPAFMAFLNEMYCQLKRRQLQLKTQQEGVPPGLVLLTLLCKCCHDCLKPSSVSSLAEMESLFFVLTAIGKDLEQELPQQLETLLNNVRDAFLTAQTLPPIRKTLLQLIELSAAKWQLPAPAVMYYYPGTLK